MKFSVVFDNLLKCIFKKIHNWLNIRKGQEGIEETGRKIIVFI